MFSRPIRRVRQRVDLLELADRYLGIDLGGRELAVSQHRLDVADVCTVVQHQGRHGVAEDVAGAGLADPGLLDVFLHQVGQTVLVEGLAVFVQEQGASLNGNPTVNLSGDELSIAFDYELNSGGLEQVALRFAGVEAFCSTFFEACKPEQIEAYDKLMVWRDPDWLLQHVERKAEDGNGLKHFSIFFDETGCFEMLAVSYVAQQVL